MLVWPYRLTRKTMPTYSIWESSAWLFREDRPLRQSTRRAPRWLDKEFCRKSIFSFECTNKMAVFRLGISQLWTRGHMQPFSVFWCCKMKSFGKQSNKIATSRNLFLYLDKKKLNTMWLRRYETLLTWWATAPPQCSVPGLCGPTLCSQTPRCLSLWVGHGRPSRRLHVPLVQTGKTPEREGSVVYSETHH